VQFLHTAPCEFQARKSSPASILLYLGTQAARFSNSQQSMNSCYFFITHQQNMNSGHPHRTPRSPGSRGSPRQCVGVPHRQKPEKKGGRRRLRSIRRAQRHLVRGPVTLAHETRVDGSMQHGSMPPGALLSLPLAVGLGWGPSVLNFFVESQGGPWPARPILYVRPYVRENQM
jgi:hypothetical protein